MNDLVKILDMLTADSDELSYAMKMVFVEHIVGVPDKNNTIVWKKFKKSPPLSVAYKAHTIIIKDRDTDTYTYQKSRDGKTGVVPDNELMWILLHV